MKRNPYLLYRNRERSLNDWLAIDRTILANERTILAYIRTSLALLAIGVTSVQFFDSRWIIAVGVIFIAASIVIALLGWVRFRRTQRYLATALEERSPEPASKDDRAAPTA